MERLSDRAIEIINELHTERLDYNSEYLPLIDAANKLNEIENIYDLDRLCELVQANRDGRCVVLPCKRGDTVWRICGPKGRKFVAPREVQSVTMYEPGKFELFTNCFDWLGKTVFLTEEEAEAALKAMKEGENDVR